MSTYKKGVKSILNPYGIAAYTGTTTVTSGSISATSSSAHAMRLYLVSGSGSTSVTNTGRIEVTTSTGWASGIKVAADATIVNSGSILVSAPDPYSIFSFASQLRLILRTGSDLSGVVCLWGLDDYVELRGTGIEDEIFEEVETLKMNGEDWSLTGSSAFDSIEIQRGRAFLRHFRPGYGRRLPTPGCESESLI